MGGMGGAGAAGFGDFQNPFDLFESFFGGSMGGAGGARARNRPVQGDDARYDLTLDFSEAIFGAEKEMSVVRLEACGACTGSGVQAGTTPRTCGTCGGSGQVITMARTPLGNFQQVAVCPECNGSGQIFTPCGECAGDGRVRRSKTISLKVPPGVDSGSRLRVRGEGNAGRRGGGEGDLYVFITVREDPELKREGVDINSSVTVPYTEVGCSSSRFILWLCVIRFIHLCHGLQAILGTSVRVRTVDGEVDLKIPAGTQPGTTMVMGKKGVPQLGNPSVRGDHLVKVNVSIPKRLSKKEKDLVTELSNMSS